MAVPARLAVEQDGRVEEVVVAAGEPLATFAPASEPTVLAARLPDRVVDLSWPAQDGVRLRWLRFADEEGRRVFRHSSAHLLAQAVKRLWPEAQLGTGPSLEDGYYYDMLLPNPLTEGDLERIEQVMRAIVAEKLPIRREEITRDEALDLFRQRREPFKCQIVERIPDGATISVYRQGEFVDLCAGPHVPNTGVLGAIKLTSVSGAYWRGDEHEPMMTRVYGTSFPSAEQLEQHLERIEEAKRRDHRVLGPQLGLFQLREEAPGFVFWLPKGVKLYRNLEDFSRRLQEQLGYEEVSTPWIYKDALWKRSGHWQHYQENMFLIDRDDEHLGVKPMNCPGHCVMFGSTVRSYRELPVKWADYGPLARYERSGTMHGLLRVRGFHQDDAHLFVRPSQIQDEIREVLDLVDRVFSAFELNLDVVFSTRPDDYLGDLATWEDAERQLTSALEAWGRPYGLNPGDGAFYGPKLDFYAIDSLGRRWQTSTVQLDYQMPQQFDLTYVEQDGSRARPVMIHRAVLGSLERFLGILIEHYAGAFPLWLAPVQVRVVPVADAQREHAEGLGRQLAARGLRGEVDGRAEKLGKKIRDAQMDKIPVVLVVGAREVETGTVSVRRRTGENGVREWGPLLDELVQTARPPA
jgi:threonyl-tRNA synthetase